MADKYYMLKRLIFLSDRNICGAHWEELYAQNTSESLRGAMDKFEEALGPQLPIHELRKVA
jgi:hypothetical protein